VNEIDGVGQIDGESYINLESWIDSGSASEREIDGKSEDDDQRPKAVELDQRVAKAFGFIHTYAITGQTYSREVDAEALGALASLASSTHKMATDLRLFAHKSELREPFKASQVGSSAMAFKKGPHVSERVCALARHMMSLHASALQTAAMQWLERSLVDSASRRMTMSEIFLCTDGLWMRRWPCGRPCMLAVRLQDNE
jgi:adenylosuccinate lyase